MKLGIVGLRGSGKTSVFRLLTGQAGAAGHGVEEIAVVHIPDPRIDRLVEIWGAKKTTYAELAVLNLMDISSGRGGGSELRLSRVAGEADIFLLVLQCFGDLGHDQKPLDPRSELEMVLLEMSLHDLGIVEGRAEKIRAKGSKRSIHEAWELHVLEKAQAHLATGGRACDLVLAEDEQKLLRGFALLTMKPLLVALNVDEDEAQAQRAAAARALAEVSGLATETVRADLAAELAVELEALDPSERAEFLAAYGFEQAPREQLKQAALRLLNMTTFLTASEREAHAWMTPAGSTAPQAAGRIHTDMEQRFNRAEVIAFADMDACGSYAEVKRRNLARLEGRDYIVKEGDILDIRFSR